MIRPSHLLTLAVTFLLGLTLAPEHLAAETIPAPPTSHVVDAAGVIFPDREAALDKRLADFERETSNQIVVALYPSMDSASSIEDYTVRVAQAWGIGQEDRDNGVVLFVFVQDRTMYIQVGYGLEGALPDATCREIIENRLKPAFLRGDFAGGISAAIGDIIAATKGEYQSSAGKGGGSGGEGFLMTVILLPVFILLVIGIFLERRMSPGDVVYTGSDYVDGHMRRGGWGGGSGDYSGGGGGGFSGGGGSFGGGGAGGKW